MISRVESGNNREQQEYEEEMANAEPIEDIQEFMADMEEALSVCAINETNIYYQKRLFEKQRLEEAVNGMSQATDKSGKPAGFRRIG